MTKAVKINFGLTGEWTERCELQPMRTHLGHLSHAVPDGVKSLGEQGGFGFGGDRATDVLNEIARDGQVVTAGKARTVSALYPGGALRLVGQDENVGEPPL